MKSGRCSPSPPKGVMKVLLLFHFFTWLGNLHSNRECNNLKVLFQITDILNTTQKMSAKGVLVLYVRDSGPVPEEGLHLYVKSEMMCN